MSSYRVQLSGSELIHRMVRDICVSGQTPVVATERALEAHIFERFSDALLGVLTKPPLVRIHSGYFKERYATLPSLCSSGYKTWYTEITFVTDLLHTIEGIEFELHEIGMLPINYGQGVQITTDLKSKRMKRQVKHELRINTLTIDKAVFAKLLHNIQSAGGLEQPLIANFLAGPDIQTLRVVAFDHMLTGERYFCSCAKLLHSHLLAEAMRIKGGYVPGAWPHQMVDLLSTPQYLPNICHLCIARSSSPHEAKRRYGSSIEANFSSYVDQVIVDLQMDGTTARAEVQQVLGLSRWVREASLYGAVRELFPDLRVLREASPEWLGRLRLDIYLPELKLAIEHQGEQHYRPLEVFGGEESHMRTMERDRIKRLKCKENGIQLIEIRYDASISKAALRQRLRRFVDAAGDLN